MGRYQKNNFDFFPFDVAFFQNKKIKALKRHYGGIGILAYIYTLCYAYGNEGCCIHLSSLEEFSYDIAESIANNDIAKVARRIAESITYMAEIGLIDKTSLGMGLITGIGIQRQYIQMSVKSRRKLDESSLLLKDEQGIPIGLNEISSEEIGISSEEIPINSEKTQQSKVKESIKEKYYKKKVSTFDVKTHDYTKAELDSLVTKIDDLEF